jgi:hypothetical protein
MNMKTSMAADSTYRYVITETGHSTSLDPLDADNTNNLPVARMIYATPLEVTKGSQLTSRVLDAYNYVPANHTIHWTVKAGLKFSDGSPLSPEDVAFAVARMAFVRPQFPVLENIIGVKNWATSKTPLKSLPKGIEVKGQEIIIRLDKDVNHPLFRFCLELFSIIPKKCVDLESNKLCKEIPTSGPYRITNSTADRIFFSKQDSSLASPSHIRFDYVKPHDLPTAIGSFDDHTVVAGSEANYSTPELRLIEERLTTKFAPASRFAALLLQPEVGPFLDKKCRQFFAREFRKAYEGLPERSQPVEASIFTMVLPGYLSVEELEQGSPLSASDAEKCRASFHGSEIRWAHRVGVSGSLFISALRQAVGKVGAKLAAPIVVDSIKEAENLFVTGKISVFNWGSGFWAVDPAGDLKMLYTPNLHKALKFSSQDLTLQSLIMNLRDDPKDYAKLNRHLFDHATDNIYTHFRRFYASPNKSLLGDISVSVTSPAPWQVFQVK